MRQKNNIEETRKLISFLKEVALNPIKLNT